MNREKTYILKNLDEEKVFMELNLLLRFKKILVKSAFEVLYYVFTEILNNAIDHSKSENCKISIKINENDINFQIKDYGIGIFNSIFENFNLNDEHSAIIELVKGKTTTMKEKHSGEGIFFSSKAVETISFRSHKLNLIFDNVKKDVFVEEKRFIKGTTVDFKIKKRSTRNLENIFNKFSPKEFDYKFKKTSVLVKLLDSEFIARSEAKRLLFNLDKFKEIVLDFKNVNLIGQGFADEIFRVFQNANPDISIVAENTKPALKSMIKHVGMSD